MSAKRFAEVGGGWAGSARTGLLGSPREEDEVDRGAAILAIVLDVYEFGKDLIPAWKLRTTRKARSQQVEGDLEETSLTTKSP